MSPRREELRNELEELGGAGLGGGNPGRGPLSAELRANADHGPGEREPGEQHARASHVKPAVVRNSEEASVAGAGKTDDAAGDGGLVGCGKQFRFILRAVRSLGRASGEAAVTLLIPTPKG